MKTFIEFSNAFVNFAINKKLNATESYGNSPDAFMENIGSILAVGKVFRIDNAVKKLLLMTDVPKLNSHLKLPFNMIFVETEFSKEEIISHCGTNKIYKEHNKGIGVNRVIGIAITRGNLINDLQGVVGSALRITTASFLENGGIWFDTFNYDVDISDKQFGHYKIKVQEGLTKKFKEMVCRYVTAFLNFVNNPEIEIIESNPDLKQNQKRVALGKPPIPSINSINVTGKLKIYIDNLKATGIFESKGFSHRFYVRGHFMTLRHKRYGVNIGKRIWKIPFIKGKGLLIEKEYYVKKKE